MEDKEDELEARSRQRDDLQHELHDMLQLMTQETRDMQRLEADIKDGTRSSGAAAIVILLSYYQYLGVADSFRLKGSILS